jgi:hypothetical protein
MGQTVGPGRRERDIHSPDRQTHALTGTRSAGHLLTASLITYAAVTRRQAGRGSAQAALDRQHLEPGEPAGGLCERPTEPWPRWPRMNLWNIGMFSFAARFRCCGLVPALGRAWVYALFGLVVAGRSAICAEHTRMNAELPGCRCRWAVTGLACPQVPPFRYFEKLVLRMTVRHDQSPQSRGMTRR